MTTNDTIADLLALHSAPPVASARGSLVLGAAANYTRVGRLANFFSHPLTCCVEFIRTT